MGRDNGSPTWVSLIRELPVIASAVIAYFGGRGLTEGSRAEAFSHARDLIDLEETLGLHWEIWLQDLIVDHRWLIDLANWIYMWGHWPVIAIAALWLFFRRPSTYFLIRNAFLISGAVGLIVFITYPVAPPRFSDPGLVDTVTLYSHSYRVLQPPGFVNQYAAMPSLHFGWNLLIGAGLAKESPLRAVRIFGWLMPVAMVFGVVLTANHFIVDVIAGAAVSLAGLLAAQQLRRLPLRWQKRWLLASPHKSVSER